jgi:SAM-dependent methyltransferase
VVGRLALAAAISVAAAAQPLRWSDLSPPIQARLGHAGVTAGSFDGFVERLNRTHGQRVREGDLDHLVHYLLQSTHFTGQAPIEPALSARALVESLSPADRAAYLEQGRCDPARVSAAVRTRAGDLFRALDSHDQDRRLVYFRELADTALPQGTGREAALLREYLRAMRFLYKKEFVAQRAGNAADAVALLYQSRGLSTDTAVEAGFVVYIGLGVLKSLDPGHRIRHVLIVGPGLDLAPRTALLDDTPPESYQPWAVLDALVGLGLARLDDLEVVGADINPRVVNHLRIERQAPPRLRLVSGIAESETLTFSPDYRDYFDGFGRSLGTIAREVQGPAGHLAKTVNVRADAASTLRAEALDIVTERLAGDPFDLVIATNILPYFSDAELTLALSSIADMLAPGGVLLHNETRVGLMEAAAAAGLPAEQSRQVVIASVRGAAPLGDTIFLHRRR